MIGRFSAGPLARLHIAYSIQVLASTQFPTEIPDKQGRDQLMAARAVGILLPPGWPKGTADTLVAFVLAIPRSTPGTTEAFGADVPRHQGHHPTDGGYEAG